MTSSFVNKGLITFKMITLKSWQDSSQKSGLFSKLACALDFFCKILKTLFSTNFSCIRTKWFTAFIMVNNWQLHLQWEVRYIHLSIIPPLYNFNYKNYHCQKGSSKLRKVCFTTGREGWMDDLLHRNDVHWQIFSQ